MSKRVVLGGLGVAVALVLAWYLLLWGPQGRQRSDAEARREAAEAENTQLELRLARLRAVEERSAALDAEAEELANAVPGSPRLGELILDADEAAVRAGVDLESVSPSEPSSGPAAAGGTEAAATPASVTEIPVTIEVGGGYFAILDFVNRLEDLPRVVVVDSLQLVTEAEEDGETRLLATLTARVFTTEPAQGAATADPATGAAAPDGSTTTTTAPGSSDGGAATTTTTAGASS